MDEPLPVSAKASVAPEAPYLWQRWRFRQVYVILRGELSNNRTWKKTKSLFIHTTTIFKEKSELDLVLLKKKTVVPGHNILLGSSHPAAAGLSAEPPPCNAPGAAAARRPHRPHRLQQLHRSGLTALDLRGLCR